MNIPQIIDIVSPKACSPFNSTILLNGYLDNQYLEFGMHVPWFSPDNFQNKKSGGGGEAIVSYPMTNF